MALTASDESLAQALDKAALRLARGEPTSETRALLIEARRLRHIIANWRSLPVYVEAREVMLEHVQHIATRSRAIFPSTPPPAPEEPVAALPVARLRRSPREGAERLQSIGATPLRRSR